MPDLAELARLFHDNYLVPRAEAVLAPTARVRKALVTIQAVNPNGKVGVAQVLFPDGTVSVLLYGAVTPSTAYYWRALAYDGGPPILDDAVPLAGTP